MPQRNGSARTCGHCRSASASGPGVPLGIVFNKHTDEKGAVAFLHACKMGLEGIVSKRLSAPYRSGPSRDRIKVKNPDSPAMIRAREHFARLGQ
jgi:hypothetical protein